MSKVRFATLLPIASWIIIRTTFDIVSQNVVVRMISLAMEIPLFTLFIIDTSKNVIDSSVITNG